MPRPRKTGTRRIEREWAAVEAIMGQSGILRLPRYQSRRRFRGASFNPKRLSARAQGGQAASTEMLTCRRSWICILQTFVVCRNQSGVYGVPMTQHPSLNAQFVEPDPIRAVAEMDPYVPCWCRSGKKYKFCHYRRERRPPINVYEVEKKMLLEHKQGYCPYPKSAGDECSPGISNAHTVQRRGGLSAIGERGHVLSVKPSIGAMIEHEGMPPPRRVGLGRASVFPGFCNKHDTAAFQRIESEDVAFDKHTALLCAYRAVAYERFAKQWQLKPSRFSGKWIAGSRFGGKN